MNPRIPVARPLMGHEEVEAVRRVIASGWVAQGPRVADFEEAVRSYCGARHAIALSSCTAALHLSMVSAGIGAGDEVILPSLTFVAAANAVVMAGGVPVFAEVRADTANLDPEDVVDRIGPRTKAILVVHQLGLPADLDAFRKLSAEHSLHLIEDAACALGSRLRGEPIGHAGDLVCFSFHARKVISTGEGGMILTQSAELAERLRSLRHHGMSISAFDRHRSKSVARETYHEVGYNYRLSDIHAAVGIAQMGRLNEIIKARKTLARRYDSGLAPIRAVVTPIVPADADWNVQSYGVRIQGATSSQRDAVMQALLDVGIATRPGVMTVHREPAYASTLPTRLPVSEMISDSSVILPLYPDMLPEQCDEVVDSLARAVEKLV